MTDQEDWDQMMNYLRHCGLTPEGIMEAVRKSLVPKHKTKQLELTEGELIFLRRLFMTPVPNTRAFEVGLELTIPEALECQSIERKLWFLSRKTDESRTEGALS